MIKDVTEHFKPVINDAVTKILNFFRLELGTEEPSKILEEFLTSKLENKLKKFNKKNLDNYLKLS